MSRASIPGWVPTADRALADAAARVRVVGLTTPINLHEELEKLQASWERVGATMPRFVYAPPPSMSGIRAGLVRAAEVLSKEGALGSIYAARAQELEAEAAICEAAGSASCWAAARRRYARRDGFDGAADAVVSVWLGGGGASWERGEEGHDEREREGGGAGAWGAEEAWSDDEKAPGSLVSRMRQEVGARRIPFRVIVLSIAPLAATGDGVIQVAARRRVRREDVERTVLHEVEGHAMPGARAATMPLGIFTVGTRWGSDDQEGRALWIEKGAGFLGERRKRELGLRHLAARSVEAGADFVETAQRLLSTGRTDVGDALRIAARVHRGGGLAREVVYVPALLRVEAALSAQPALDEVLGAGRVSVEAAEVLAAWLPR
ncbi:tyrosine/phenylalanine carboxypeptidase domain-containing protein [Chondromyces crocatus]|uniref:DUF1704 domain-containing protein n=1 Tax=Chondromyces crocatus TaxID=52 RepID=A0A0K1EMW3_CHOCO|nr:tyrosine/phenylalanine carboxypeptidase domain-containing protein [Chondromyces crocatus]AKT41968.1 uncharacterized protein CMC5_061900 [Chondromyces crocatus]